MSARGRPVACPVGFECLALRAHAGVSLEDREHVAQARESPCRQALAELETAESGERSLGTAFLPVEGHDEARGKSLPRAKDRQRLGGGRSRREHVVEDHRAPPRGVGPHEDPAFAVILDLLAVKTPGDVASVAPGESDGRRAHERDALVRRSEEDLELEAARDQHLRVELTEGGEVLTAVERRKIEKVGTLAPGFEREAAEAERAAVEDETGEAFGDVHAPIVAAHGRASVRAGFAAVEARPGEPRAARYHGRVCPDGRPMLRVTTFNANGLRAAVRKGFYDWLLEHRPDVVALQEVRARPEEIPPPPDGYRFEVVAAERAGYAGVALLARRPLRRLASGFGHEEFDREGRLLLADLGPCRLAALYVPSGSQGPERQASKDRFLEAFPPVLARWHAEVRTIVAGDFNIAHRAIDLRNAKNNEKHSGFLPHERAWMDRLLAPGAWVDTLRLRHPDTPGLYTWWTYRGRAWEKDVGWRIDYQLVTPDLAPAVRHVAIARETRFSDHAPYTVDYDLDP